MKTLNEFLKEKTTDIIAIISSSNLKSPFNSHDFIERFTHIFESEYIYYLEHYKGKGAFRTVHSIIAKYLSKNKKIFKIERIKKVGNKNVFGYFDYIQKWEKLT